MSETSTSETRAARQPVVPLGRRPVPPSSVWPHVAAWCLAWGTLVLLGVGALVTTFGAGMAVPDWPNSFGYWMFGLPADYWIPAMGGAFDVFLEHGHRVMGSIVGLITIGLVLTVVLCDGRAWLVTLSVAALVLVIFQGTLGGMRVVLDAQTLAMIHGMVAPLFFALVGVLLLVSSRGLDPSECRPLVASDGSIWLYRALATLLVAATYAQIVFGGYLRHFHGGHWYHILLPIGLFVLATTLLVLAHTVLKEHRPIRRLATLVFALLVVQTLLGVGAWTAIYGLFTIEPYRHGLFEAVTTMLHVVFGSILFASTVVQVVRAEWLPLRGRFPATRSTSLEAAT